MAIATNARERLALMVGVLGALTTIATSAVQDPEVRVREAVHLDAGGEHVHLIVRASRSAVRHAELGQVSMRGSGPIVITPDDAGLASELEATGSGLVRLGDPEELCPGEGACDIGFDLFVDAPSGTFTLDVEAALSRSADTRFLFPENRDFPADATIELVIE